MKLTSNDNAHAFSRPHLDDNSETMISNNNLEEGNNQVILSNSNQGENGTMLSDDNNELKETVIDDVLSLSASTAIHSNTKEGNNNSILSNQQINTNSSKRPSRLCSAVGDHESWCTAIGDKESHSEFANNSSADDCTKNNNNKNNILNHKEQCAPCSLQKATWDNLDAREDTTENEANNSIVNKHSFHPEVSLERHTQDDRFHSNNMNPKNKEQTVVSDAHQREVEAISCCTGSSLLGMTTEFPAGKRESLLVQEESERNASQPIKSFNERESNATKNTEIIKVTQEISESLPNYLNTLAEGKSVCGDTYVPLSKPDWLDMEKFLRGQRFANNHIFGVMFAELMSLMILFAFRGGLEPLIFTGKSDTPFKAFKRYLSTVSRVKSWYEGDIWDVDSVAHKNLKVVRGIHNSVRKNMEAVSQQEVAKRVTLENKEDTHPMWTDLHEEILDDFHSSCPYSRSPMPSQKEVFINQFDMGITQFGFLGLIMVFPKMFGVHYASDEDFEGFAHFWRTIGYLLGTGDRFNLCNGDLKTVRQRCLDIIEYWVKPKFREVSRDWIHMSRCVFRGVSFYVPNVQFEVMLMYLCKVLDIKAVKLAASLTFWQYCMYLETVFLYWFTFRLPGMWRLHNWLINLAVKRALHMAPERLTKLEHRVHPYETSSNTTSTRL